MGLADQSKAEGGELSVRPAAMADLGALVRFNQQMALSTEGKQLDEAVLTAGVRRGIEGRARYLVAEIEGQVAGALMLTREWSDWRDGDFLWIQSVFVEPAFRRRGVYRALHRAVVEEAEADPDVCGVRLYVEIENRVAQQTYGALGMTECAYRMFEVSTPSR